jgi:hypothetical protein
MKRQRSTAKKAERQPGKGKQNRNSLNIAVGWGRAGSQYRPGLFTKQYFVDHGEACCADVYYALSQEIERLNKGRIEISEKPLRRPNYSSFARYFHWFVLLDLIKRVDKQETAIYDFLKPRQFYRLTAKGEAEEEAWQDPARAAHPEFAK